MRVLEFDVQNSSCWLHDYTFEVAGVAGSLDQLGICLFCRKERQFTVDELAELVGKRGHQPRESGEYCTTVRKAGNDPSTPHPNRSRPPSLGGAVQ